MSYEGYTSYLCTRGHLNTRDSYDWLTRCPDCDESIKWKADTDQTNGYVEDEPSTHPPKLEPNSWDDIWLTDHYGNRYATKLYKWKPLGDRWVEVRQWPSRTTTKR